MDQSQLLLELKRQRRQKRSRLDPAHKIIAAFSLSVEARKLRIAWRDRCVKPPCFYWEREASSPAGLPD